MKTVISRNTEGQVTVTVEGDNDPIVVAMKYEVVIAKLFPADTEQKEKEDTNDSRP